jgi:hypothetical protein
VALVPVVPGKRGRVRPAKRLEELGLALETDPKRVRAQLGERKHLSGDLEDRGLGAKRKRLLGAGEREALIARLGGIHRPMLDSSTTAMLHPGFVGAFEPVNAPAAPG